MADKTRKLIVGITGATGSICGIRMLQLLQDSDVETHLIVSKWGGRTLVHETRYTLDQVKQMANHVYQSNDQGAVISSGSFSTSGMVIAPCSMRTLAAIAHGQSDDLIHRAADVILKERRKLVLVPREAPLNEIHLENMLKLSRMGVIIAPPVPAFYNHPRSVDDIVDYTVARILDQLGIQVQDVVRWNGVMSTSGSLPPED